MPDAVRVDGLALTAEFAGSWQRMATLALLVAMALQFAVGLVLGRLPVWLRRVGAVSYTHLDVYKRQRLQRARVDGIDWLWPCLLYTSRCV